MAAGRPLRFLLLVTGGWTVARTLFVLWPSASPEAVGTLLFPPAEASAVPVPRKPIAVPFPPSFRHHRSEPLPAVTTIVHSDPPAKDLTVPPSRTIPVDAAQTTPGMIPPPLFPTPRPTPPSRWAASAWAIARGGGNTSLLGGQLGGSQAGVRLTYAVQKQVALAARLAGPLEGRGREAAVGVEWRPTRLPVRLIAEQRFGLDGNPGGPTAMIVGGIDPTPIAAGFKLEAYAQAGVIVRARVDGFADGAMRVTHALTKGSIRVDLGMGMWGGAQPRARRLDTGPTLGVSVPVAGQRMRLSLDWRQRIAGDAAPGSGPALSIGTDF